MDKEKQLLLDALKQAGAEAGEQRLFRTGKLSGLFAGRTTGNAAAAELALREGLLESVRTEIKGKTPIEWVRITPKGLDFVARHESPLRALEELRQVLQVTQDGLPGWLGQLQQQVQDLGQRLAEEVRHIACRVERLSQRVDEVLTKMAQAPPPPLPVGTAPSIPWEQLALGYLDQRQERNANGPCPLPELFTLLRQHKPELTIKDFHAGLRRLHDRGAVRLLPFTGEGELPEPEYALLDGTAVYYFTTR